MTAKLRELCINASPGRFKKSPKVEKRKTSMRALEERTVSLDAGASESPREPHPFSKERKNPYEQGHG